MPLHPKFCEFYVTRIRLAGSVSPLAGSCEKILRAAISEGMRLAMSTHVYSILLKNKSESTFRPPFVCVLLAGSSFVDFKHDFSYSYSRFFSHVIIFCTQVVRYCQAGIHTYANSTYSACSVLSCRRCRRFFIICSLPLLCYLWLDSASCFHLFLLFSHPAQRQAGVVVHSSHNYLVWLCV